MSDAVTEISTTAAAVVEATTAAAAVAASSTSAASAASATPEAAPSTKIYSSMDEIFKEILDLSGLESFDDVPRTARIVWVGPDDKPIVIDLVAVGPDGKPGVSNCPLDNNKSFVCGLFHDEDEVRVYTLPKPNIAHAPSCYHLSKRGRTLVVDQFVSLPLWIMAMGEEYAMLAAFDDDDEEEETTAAAT